MSIQSRLGRGEELQSNCKIIRLSTAWEINNPANWQFSSRVLGVGSAKGSVFYSGFNNQLFLMDSSDSSQYVNSPPSTVYRPSYYDGLFYSGPVLTLGARHPPEWELTKGGEIQTTNVYSTRWLGGSVENTPVPTFTLIGPAIATPDLAFSHGPNYANSFISNGRYECNWVLGPGPREYPEIRGNPGPSPRPREPRHDDPPEDEEEPETKTLDLISFFFFLEETDGTNEHQDYGDYSFLTSRLESVRRSVADGGGFTYNIQSDLTSLFDLVPPPLLRPHGVSFLPDKKQILVINNNNFNISKSKTRHITKIYYDLTLEPVKEQKVIVFEIPPNSKVWSYSASPN